MMAALTNVSSAFSANYTLSESQFSTGFNLATISQNDSFSTAFTTGTGSAGKFDQHYEASGATTTAFAIPTASPLTLTLSALGADKFGRTMSFAHITSIWIRITDTTPTGHITLEPGATNSFTALTGATGALVINRFFMWVDDVTTGLAAGAGASDKIKLTASAGTVNIAIGITGTYA